MTKLPILSLLFFFNFVMFVVGCGNPDSDSASLLKEELYSCTLVNGDSEVSCTEYMLNEPSAINFGSGACNESNGLVFRKEACSDTLKNISSCEIPATSTETSKTTYGYDESTCNQFGGNFSN